MKKVILSIFVVLFAVSFTACQKNEDAGGDKAKTTGTDTNKVAADAAPAKEAFIEKAESLPKTKVKFDKDEFDFGKIKEGDEVSHRFNFTNVGTNDLVITNVKPSCGCTTPTYSQDPVKPGEKGFIDVKFNSSGKTGMQNKNVTVTANLEENINAVLKLKGEVEPKKDGGKPGEEKKEEKH
ncbi:MAG: DUF1573 domain-containing protein [Bacteroidia bacterium]|nr:DUF1573 domain-containing protein [Bacteroidia bacterium]